MKRTAKRVGRVTLGGLFLILGVVGLFLPILQGILFLIVGVLLLSVDVPFFRRLVLPVARRYPNAARKAARLLGLPPPPVDDEPGEQGRGSSDAPEEGPATAADEGDADSTSALEGLMEAPKED